MPIYMGVFTKPGVLDQRFRGGVTASGYEGWIELQSAQVGTARSSGATGTSKRPIQEITVTKLQDAASNAIFREALNGEGKLIVIAFVKEGQPAMKIVLQSAMIGSYSVTGARGSAAPMESFSLNFIKITFDTSPTSPDTTHAQLYQLSQQANAASYS
jgi:type VI secretion system secreted protein Hcp